MLRDADLRGGLVMLRTLMCTSLMLAFSGTLWAQILDVRELNTEQIGRLDRARTVVLLTAGILEEHGPFLPSYSDGYQSEFVATRLADAVAARPGWTVLRFPEIPLGAFPASYVGGKYVFPGSYPVRMTTLRAVFMDLATDLGEAGFKWVFVLTMHGGPPHNRALDEAAQYFNETYGGRMVHVTGFTSVVGTAPSDLFTSEQRTAEGFSIHADADEHSCLLFLRPDLVAPGIRSAPAVVSRDFAELVATAQKPGWTGYFGTPAIATPEAGRRAMDAIAQAAVDVVLNVLEGGSAQGPRVADRPRSDPAFRRVVEGALEHERRIERKQAEWLAKQR
jgi:creatinine amidohydrolase/Fe(II)-dependent formamide hydrolase-like protein